MTSPETREVVSHDPATGEVVGSAPVFTADDVQNAVMRARATQPGWASLSFTERGRIILKARKIVLAGMEEIAALIARETGKPVAEAISMEIVPTLDLMYYFARQTANLLQPQKIDIGHYGLMGRSSRIEYRPHGVVGIISPWNFPWATPFDEIVMALMAGNSVVVKPSELTSLTALKIGKVLKQAGLAEGLLEIVTGDGSTGAALVDAGVDKIVFTGSVATGRRDAELAARHLTPVVLELGGKDPMIVFEDTNINNTARAAVWGAFANSGQACASVERCYVHESIASAFIEQVVAETRALKQGPPSQSEIDVGAMSNERQLRIVDEHVTDAVQAGGKVLTGGQRFGNPKGWFFEPTVLTNVDHAMKIMREETFGPVLPIMTFKTEAEAIKLANDSPFGLTASVWTRDLGRGRRVASKLEAGTVMLNEVVYTHAIGQTPWGGVKQSGYGRTHGRMGLLELVIPQHVHVNRLGFLPDLWWFRYSANASKLFQGLGRHFTTDSVMRTFALLPGIIRRLLEYRQQQNRKR